MILKIIYLTYFLFSIFSTCLYGQNEFSIQYYHTAEDKSFENILNDSTLKFAEYEVGKTYFNPKETYWIKIKSTNHIELKNFIFIIGTPVTNIECYAFDKNNSLKVFQAGIFTSYQNQIIKSGDKNKVYLNFSVKNNTIFLKIKNELLFKYNFDNFEIKPVNEWVLNKEKQHLFQGLFIGVLLVLIIISILYKISATKYINYYYIGYLFSLLILFLFLNEHTVAFIFITQYRLDMCFMVSMHFASLFYIQFARHYFEIDKLYPILDTIAKKYVLISLITAFCFVMIAYFDFPLYSYIAVILEIFNQFFGLLLLFFAFKKTTTIGKLIIIGAFISTFDIVFMIYNNHIVEFTTKDLFFYQTGYLIEVLFILIAIRLRYSQVEIEQQKSLIKNAVLMSENKIKEQENLLLKKENDIAQLKTELLQKEINQKDKEIAVSSLQITQKDLLLVNMHERLKKINPEAIGNHKEVNNMIQTLANYKSENFWKEFEIYFEQIHNGFFSKLSEKFPVLTQNEKRLCAFLKVGMTSKEIATITQKNYKSIEVFRSRIRKKLKIETEENLTEFLNKV